MEVSLWKCEGGVLTPKPPKPSHNQTARPSTPISSPFIPPHHLFFYSLFLTRTSALHANDDWTPTSALHVNDDRYFQTSDLLWLLLNANFGGQPLTLCNPLKVKILPNLHCVRCNKGFLMKCVTLMVVRVPIGYVGFAPNALAKEE